MIDALESVIRYARTKLQEEVATMDDKTDGTVKHCLENTSFSPDEYPQAWETVG